jgi:hypothetical protein
MSSTALGASGDTDACENQANSDQCEEAKNDPAPVSFRDTFSKSGADSHPGNRGDCDANRGERECRIRVQPERASSTDPDAVESEEHHGNDTDEHAVREVTATQEEFGNNPDADLRTDVIPTFYRHAANFHCAYRER